MLGLILNADFSICTTRRIDMTRQYILLNFQLIYLSLTLYGYLLVGLLDHQGSFGSKGVNQVVNEAEALLQAPGTTGRLSWLSIGLLCGRLHSIPNPDTFRKE